MLYLMTPTFTLPHIVVAVLTKMSNGILYIEQDGSILNGDQAIKEAQAWEDLDI